jgi:hypothetical protein
MKNVVFWNLTSCGSYENQNFEGTYRLHHQGNKHASMIRLLVIANVVSSSPILVTLIMEAI